MTKRADLVVIRGNTIVFSNYFAKPNSTASRLELNHFIDLTKNLRFIIPFSLQHAFLFQEGVTDPVANNFKTKPGPSMLSLHKGHATEYAISTAGENVSRSIPVSRTDNSVFYCRSTEYDLETAAQAGCMIYDDPVKIYRESYKALGLTTYPFYEGDIVRICNGVENFHEIFEEPVGRILDQIKQLNKLDSPPEKEIARLEEQKNKIMLGFSKAIADADKLLGLKLHDAV